jgi:hypothetical protein
LSPAAKVFVEQLDSVIAQVEKKLPPLRATPR